MRELKIIIKKIYDKVKIPTKAYDESLGFDIYPHSIESISPGFNTPGVYTVKFNTGLSIKIPDGYGALLKERSGSLSWRYPAIIRAGVIDSDYTGEWKIAFNVFCESSVKAQAFAKELIASGKAICQAVIVPKHNLKFVETKKMERTNRGSKGFGSSDRI